MRLHLRTFVLAVLIAALAPAVHARAATVEQVVVLDSGTYQIETGEATGVEGTPTGEVTAVDRAVPVSGTDTVAASPGTEFGFRYVVVGEPVGEEVPLDFVIVFPEAGLTNPETGDTLRESRFSATKRIGKTEYMGYGIEAEWEAVPGAWSFRILHEGRQLARRDFTVSR